MKYTTILLFATGMLFSFGCERFQIGNAFLEKAPGVDVTKDSVFMKAEYAERFLVGSYLTLPYGLDLDYSQSTMNYRLDGKWRDLMMGDILESLTDLTHSYLNWGGPFTLYYNGSYSAESENYVPGVGGAPPLRRTYTKYDLITSMGFVGIRSARIFIENIDKTPDMDTSHKKMRKAEAMIIIGIHYMEYLRHFGGMPWISKAISINDDLSHSPRLTAQATCDSIVALCDKAVKDLPWIIENKEADDGRFTKASAMGLKTRALLFNASPIFNDDKSYLDGEASQQKLTWHGGYNVNLWKKAADAAYELIQLAESTGDYGVYSTGNYRKDFQDAYYKRGLKETIISTRVMFKTSGEGSYTFYSSSFSWGSTCPTQNYVDMFPMANGLPITDPASGYDPNNPYVNRDPRLYETILVNGDNFQGRTAELWIGGRERRLEAGTQAATGYIIRKFMLDHDAATSIGSITHWPWLRMAEIYLSYAEAINEFSNGPTAEAYRCVNVVRNRVGLGALAAGLTKEQFREAVLLERALEFGMEEVRWFDLIRWKRESDFKKKLYGVNISRSASAPYTYTYNLFELPKRYWQDNFSPKWYFSAFPPNEINKGYGLVQNPGW